LDNTESWDQNLPSVVFAYNKSYHASIGILHMRHYMDDAAEH